MRKRRGSLLTTLIWLALIAGLGMILASLSVQHLSAAVYQENRQIAQQLARSAVSRAISRLSVDIQYGRAASAASSLSIEGPQGSERSRGWLTFQPQPDVALPYSTNNLEGSAAVPGWNGRVVPKNSALLVSEGRSGGVIQRVEAIIAMPPYPYAVASAGPVLARRGVTVAGVHGALGDPLQSDTPLLPANMLSNDASGDAVFLGPNTRVTGDVTAVGHVKLDAAAVSQGSIDIGGRVKNGSAAEKLPDIELSDYDPQITNPTQYTALPNGLLSGGVPLTGSFRRQGPLEVTQGLNMDGGVLYVHGDLTVHGGLRGKGLVVATGLVKIDGQSSFQAGGGVAVLAGSDLSVSGSGLDGSYFQGLVYTEGSLSADRVTLLGSMIAAGQQNPRPVVLENARVIHQDDPLAVPTNHTTYTHLNLAQPGSPPENYANAYFSITFSEDNGDWSAHLEWGPNSGDLEGSLDRHLGRTRQEVSDNLYDLLNGIGRPTPQALQIYRLWVDGVMDASTGGVPVTGGGGGGTTTASILTIDPSQFLHPAERMRVVLWREE